MSFDYVLYEMSYSNVILYGAVLPSYSRTKKDDNEELNADDPKNAEQIKSILFNE